MSHSLLALVPALDPVDEDEKAPPRRGMAWLEIIVAVLIVVLAILALVGTQAAIKREQSGAKLRTDAAYLAADLVGTMWGDAANIAQYSDRNCDRYARCSAWLHRVRAEMPAANAAVAVDGGTGGVSITLAWSAPDGGRHQYIATATIKTSGS